MGLVSPLGSTKSALWEALSAGKSGVGQLAAIPPSFLPTHVAAEVREFTGDIENFGPLEKEQKKAIRKGLKVMCRECQMGVAAAQLALSDAGLVVGGGTYDPERSGCIFGADYMLTMPEEFSAGINRCRDPEGTFDFNRWATEGMPQLSPLWLLKYLPNMPASHVAIYNDLRGPNNSITHREAAANLAIGEAYRTILRGSADTMVVGATGTRVHPMKTVHAIQTEELAGNGVEPAKASRPFDKNRTGMVIGEGAGAIVIEELATAKARGATDVRGNRRPRFVARGRHQLRCQARCCPGQRHAQLPSWSWDLSRRGRPHSRPRFEHPQLRYRRSESHPRSVRR